MPEWMIWMALIWVFFAFRGRHGCGWSGARGHLHGGRGATRLDGAGRGDTAFGTPSRPVRLGARSSHTGAGRGSRGARPTSAARSRPTPDRRETAEERLRRQFVEGRLTIEEYEAKLWEEIGGR